MPLQLICGRAHSGKSTYLLDIIKELADNGKKLILMVPEQFAHIAEMRLLRKVGRILDDVIEITSFNRLARRTIDMTDGAGDNVISSTAKSLIMSGILAETELEYYGNISREPGFVDVCLETVSEFKKYNISLDMQIQAADSCDNELLAMKLRDFARISEAYEKAMAEQYVDSDDLLNILYDILCNKDLYGDCVFLFDEFSTFIPQEERIITELIKQSTKVYMTLCMDRDLTDTLFLPCVTTYNRLTDICRDEHIELCDTIWLGDTFYSNSALSFAEKKLFSYPSEAYRGDASDISVVKAKNPYSEVDNAARHILSLVRDNKLRYKDICIICSDISRYNYIIYNVFSRYNIPFFIDEKTPVLQHHIVVFVLSILDVYISGYSYESIFNFIKSGFAETDAEKISVLENFISATNAAKNLWLNDERWDVVMGNYAVDNKAESVVINEIRQKYILPLSRFHDAVKGRNSAKKAVGLLYEYLREIGLTETISRYVRYFEKKGDALRQKEYSAVWDIIVRVLDEIYDVIGDRTVSCEQLRDYLYVAFAHQSIGVIPTAVDRVTVGDIARTRTDGVKAVVVLGANEGVFPVPSKNTSLISDKEKRILDKLGLRLSTTSDIQAFYNQFLIYRVITMADSMLYVSYSTADSSYNTLSPSFTIERLKKIFGKIVKDDTFEDITNIDSISGGSTAVENLITVVNKVRKGEEVPEFWDSVYSYYRDCGSDTLQKALGYFKYTNPIRPVSPDSVSAQVGEDMHTTVSRLQRYASCRYSYFLSYMLYLKEKPRADLQGVDIGSIVHDVIEKICVGMEADGVSFETADKEYFRKKIRIMLDKYIQRLGCEYAQLSKRQLYSIKRLEYVILLCFETIQKQFTDSKFVPMGYEIVFDDENIGCIEIKLDDGRVLKLTGKIDRADVYTTEGKNYLRVVDYKTGSKSFNMTDVVTGIDIQLLVYLSALVESGSNNMYGGAFFFPVSDVIVGAKNNMSDEDIESKVNSATKMKGIIIDDKEILDAFDRVTVNRVGHKTSAEQFEALSAYLKKVIKDLWSDILKGSIEANPYKKGTYTPCMYCPYSSVCRISSGNSGCSYNEIDKLDDKSAWDIIQGGEDNGDRMD